MQPQGPRESAAHMRPFHQPKAPIAALAILLTSTPLALSGCGQDPDTAGLENNTIENVQVTLPPSIKASHPYRCEDNSVVTIDLLSDDVTTNLRREGALSQLKAPAPGEAFPDGRHTVAGAGNTIEPTRPGKKTKHP